MSPETQRHLLVVLSTITGHGGIPRFNRLLCRAIDELSPDLGLRVTLIAQDETTESLEKEGLAWSRINFRAGGGKQKLALLTLAQCIRQRTHGLLIGHIGMTPVGLLCGAFLRRGYVFVAHGREAWSVQRWSRRLAARRASRVFTVSEYTGRLLVQATGLDPERLRLLPNALEPGLEASLDGHQPDHRPLELLSVSRLSEQGKGIDHTLKAFSQVLTRHHALRYRVVGTGPDKPRLVELARSLSLAEHVTFEENLTDRELADRYRRCSVFVLPSGQEGFGIVFLEAMRFGRPCIGGRPGGTPEVIEDGRTGLLVPFGDAEALRQAIERLIANPELCRAMGARGRRRVEEHFTFARFRERVGRHLAEWLGGGLPVAG